MSPQPHRNSDAKVEGRDESQETEGSPHDRFRALAAGILAVPVEQVREEERKWREGREARPNEKPSRLTKVKRDEEALRR